MRKGDTYWHNLDVRQRFVKRFFRFRWEAATVEQLRVREDRKLQDRDEKEARAPDEVADEL